MNDLICIIGDLTEHFVGRKLPSKLEVISVFYHSQKVLKQKYKVSLQTTIKKVEEKWMLAGIPTCGKRYAIKKLKKLLNEVGNFRKKLYRTQEAKKKAEKSMFRQHFIHLFDIAKSGVEKLIDSNKNLFLEGQRSKTRFGLIEETDKLEKNATDISEHSAGRFYIFIFSFNYSFFK